ncbi:MAG: hypothetical protein K8F30_13135, partial [Taibaiella sp.]|nr:hypothetical protein [Taibaiella sp.]
MRVLLLSVCCLLGIVRPAQAGGIPVIDVVHITETIASYVQQLKDYKELLGQTGLLDSQYLQMLTDYAQVLQEYRHYLNQIKGLKHTLSPTAWKSLLASIAPSYGS